MNRRGQGISINVIVIAAIALLVLVILSVLVLRSVGPVKEGTSCQQLGGRCVIEGDIEGSNRLEPCGPKTGGYDYNRAGACQKISDETAYCCMQI